MPNRILKESICRSDTIDSLSWFEEVLFYRLIVNCDDYGRFDARLKIIKNTCFPLKDIRENDVEKALNALSAVGLVRVYEAQGRPVLQLVTWEQHQNIRAKKSKYPAYDSTCIHLYADDRKCSRNPIQSESNSESNMNTTYSCPEPSPKTPGPDEPTADVEAIPLNNGSEWRPTLSRYEEYCRLYPAVDIRQAFRNMRGWCLENPSKRKTPRGVGRFVALWLAREQDRGGRRSPSRSGNGIAGGTGNHRETVTEFAQRMREWADG